MIPKVIEGFTRALGAPADWDAERDGACGNLPIRDGMNGGAPNMVSCWEPTPAEIAAIVSGEKVYLSVIGFVHPPVMLLVGDQS